MTQSTPIQTPPKLTQEQLANLSMDELGAYNDRFTMAAAQECGADKQAFLKKYPSLDFRMPTPPN